VSGTVKGENMNIHPRIKAGMVMPFRRVLDQA
jgi:hypothetical protein